MAGRGLGQHVQATNDSSANQRQSTGKKHEQFHQGKRCCGARAQSGGTQPEAGTTDHEVKERDRRNCDNHDKQGHKSTEQQSHERHVWRLHRG